jgi:hypothetical protein
VALASFLFCVDVFGTEEVLQSPSCFGFAFRYWKSGDEEDGLGFSRNPKTGRRRREARGKVGRVG